MGFYIDRAIRTRHCEECGRDIIHGEKHLRFSKGSGMYSVTQNLCRDCLIKMMDEF